MNAHRDELAPEEREQWDDGLEGFREMARQAGARVEEGKAAGDRSRWSGPLLGDPAYPSWLTEQYEHGETDEDEWNVMNQVAATIIGAVSAFVAVQLVSTAITAILAHSVARAGEEGVVQALFNLTWGLDVVAAIPSAVFFLAASMGLRRTNMVPAWLSAAGLGVAALFILRSTNWATEGFWSPNGEYLFILIPLALLWILTTSVVLLRSTAEPTARSKQLPAQTV